MTLAHKLFEALGMTLEKGATTRYPASSVPENKHYRFWATELEGCIQFGIQLRSNDERWSLREKERLERFGFRSRPNGREYFVVLPTEPEEAEMLAHATVALIQRLYLGNRIESGKLVAER